eukprot:5887765-Prymnesium_polylepis.1
MGADPALTNPPITPGTRGRSRAWCWDRMRTRANSFSDASQVSNRAVLTDGQVRSHVVNAVRRRLQETFARPRLEYLLAHRRDENEGEQQGWRRGEE